MNLLKLLFLCLFATSIYSNECRLKIAKSEYDLFKSSAFIYDSGKLNEEWKSTYRDLYISDYFNNIDYFYIMEFKESTTASNDIINFEISSDKKEVEAKVVIKDSNPMNMAEKLNDLFFKSFEVTYTCPKTNDDITTLVNLKVKTKDCEEFTFSWYKTCAASSGNHNLSDLNISFSEKQNIFLVKNGQTTDLYQNMEVPIKQSVLKLSLSLSKSSIELDTPILDYDQNEMEALITSDLKYGGSLSEKPRDLTLVFACKSNVKDKSDIQLVLREKGNKKSVTFNFKKKCDTITQMESYFTFLYIVYWIMMCFVIIFAFSTGIYFLNRNGLTLEDLYASLLKKIKTKCRIIRDYISSNSYSSIEIEDKSVKSYDKDQAAKEINQYGVL